MERVGTEIDKNGTIIDERNSRMPPEELKEWNEKNFEGRLNEFEYLGRTKKRKTSLQKKMKNYLHFETREEKILELHQQNLDELLKNELNHDDPP